MSQPRLTPFRQEWTDLASRFGLRVQISFRIYRGDHGVEVPALLRDFGAKRGMLLVTEYEQISGHSDRIVQSGCGFSCFSEPGPPRPGDDEVLVEMLLD